MIVCLGAKLFFGDGGGLQIDQKVFGGVYRTNTIQLVPDLNMHEVNR